MTEHLQEVTITTRDLVTGKVQEEVFHRVEKMTRDARPLVTGASSLPMNARRVVPEIEALEVTYCFKAVPDPEHDGDIGTVRAKTTVDLS